MLSTNALVVNRHQVDGVDHRVFIDKHRKTVADGRGSFRRGSARLICIEIAAEIARRFNGENLQQPNQYVMLFDQIFTSYWPLVPRYEILP